MQVCVILIFAVVSAVSLALAQTAQPTAAERPLQSPEVTHTEKGPTGYTVTFRYASPTAKKVQIRGDWYFARPSALTQYAGNPDHPFVDGQALLPKDWQPGDFPLTQPNRLDGGGWPLTDMTKGNDGVWTYTTPLPSGVFTYSFTVDCTGPDLKKCTAIPDPNNRAWNVTKDGIVDGSVTRSSQVYVPSDPNFNTVDYSWQGPARHKGKLTHVTYQSPGHVAPANVNYLAIYTPPNYDPARAKPYPTLYLSHGRGGNEMDWSTSGVAGDIIDNLINTGQIQPLVVVMPNEMGFSDDGFYEPHDRDLIDNIIPYIEKNYHVSTSSKDRAFSGLSMGGMLTNSVMINHPEAFQYFGMMSAGLPKELATLTPNQIAALKGKSILIGAGWQDPIFEAGMLPTQTGPAREVSTFAKAGIPVMTDFVNGGHEMYVWRTLLRDFLTRVAFLPQPYAAW
jgi:enterochelin esterase-like enzyme